MDRPDNNFVVLQFGDGVTDSVMLNLPPELLGSSASTTATTTASTTASNTTSNTAPSANESQTSPQTNENSGETDRQRNMLLSVSYIYAPTNFTNNDTQTPSNDGSTARSFYLNIPNVPEDRTDAQFTALIEFATSIALTAITATSRVRRGISKETFEAFPKKVISDPQDNSCSICFENYLSIDEADTNSKKRRRDDDNEKDNNEELHKSKRTGIERSDIVPLPSPVEIAGSSQTPSESQPPQEQSAPSLSSTSVTSYTHIPIQLPCGHTFGQDCLYEWLKSNLTCPLCRQAVHNETIAPETTDRINLPNITQLLNGGSSERPVVIFFDRNTNTVTRRPDEGESATPAPPQDQVQRERSRVYRPLGTRSAFTSNLLSSLNRLTGTDALFTNGVASRRTEQGVETINLDNNSGNDFENFYEESRRLVEERLEQVAANRPRSSGFRSGGFRSGGFFGLTRPIANDNASNTHDGTNPESDNDENNTNDTTEPNEATEHPNASSD